MHFNIYTKNLAQLKEFAVSIKLGAELEGKSKIATTKLIQKSIERRLNEEGESAQKVEWVQNAIKSLKPELKGNEHDDALSELKKQIDKLKQKRQVEMNDILEKLVQKAEQETKDNSSKLECS